MADPRLAYSREDIESAWRDPDFHKEPEDLRLQIMSEMDPLFSQMNAIQKRKVLFQMAQKFGPKEPLQPSRPNTEVLAAQALAESGLPPAAPPDQGAVRVRPEEVSRAGALIPSNPFNRTPQPSAPTPTAPTTPQPVSQPAPAAPKLAAPEPLNFPPSKPTGSVLELSRRGPYATVLTPSEETEFKKWVVTNNVPFDPGPQSTYDMRGYWRALRNRDQRAAAGDPLNPPSEWMTPFHPDFSNKSIFAGKDAPKWMGDKLVDAFGRPIRDKAAEREGQKAMAQQQKQAEKLASKGLDQVFQRTPLPGGNVGGASPVQTPLAEPIMGAGPMGIPGAPNPGVPQPPDWREMQTRPGVEQPDLVFDPMIGGLAPSPESTPEQLAQFGKDDMFIQGVRSAATGAISMGLTAPGGVLQMAGNATGSDLLRNTGDQMTSVGNQLEEGFSAPPVASFDEAGPQVFANPAWWGSTIGNGLGTMLPLMATGAGAGALIEKALQMGLIRGRLAEMVVKYGPSAVAGLSEGILAGGSAYLEAKQMGKSEEEAQQAFSIVAAGTAATAIPAFKAGVFNDTLRGGTKVLSSAGTEGIQEIGQGVFENIAADRPLEAGQVENFVGGAFGGAGGAMMDLNSVDTSGDMQAAQRGMQSAFPGQQGPFAQPPAPQRPPAPQAAQEQPQPQSPPQQPTPTPASPPTPAAEAAPQAPPPPPKRKNPTRPAAPAPPTIEEIPTDIEQMLDEEEQQAAPAQEQAPQQQPKWPEEPPKVDPVEVVSWDDEDTPEVRIYPRPDGKFAVRAFDKESGIAFDAPITGSRELIPLYVEDSIEKARERASEIMRKFTPPAPAPQQAQEEQQPPQPVDENKPAEPQQEPKQVASGSVPDHIRSKVQIALDTLRSYEQAMQQGRAADDKFGGEGRYENEAADEWMRSNGKNYKHALATIAAFRAEAPKNNVDADTFFNELGGVPQLQASDRAKRYREESKKPKAPAPDAPPAAPEPAPATQGETTTSSDPDEDRYERARKILREEGQISRQRLRRAWGFSPQAAARILDRMREEGLIEAGDYDMPVRATEKGLAPPAPAPEPSGDSGELQAEQQQGRRVRVTIMPGTRMQEIREGTVYQVSQGINGEPVYDVDFGDGPQRVTSRDKVQFLDESPAPAAAPAAAPAQTPAPPVAPQQSPAPDNQAADAGMTDEELEAKILENLTAMGLPPPDAAAPAASPAPTAPRNPMRPRAPKAEPAPAPAKKPNPLEAMAKAAEERLKKMVADAAKGTQVNAGFDPTALVDLGTLGAYYFLEGVTAAKAWTSKLMEAMGPAIRLVASKGQRSVSNLLKKVHDLARSVARRYSIEVAEAAEAELEVKDDVQSADDRGPLGSDEREGVPPAEGSGPAGEGSGSGGRKGGRRSGGREGVGDERDGGDRTEPEGVGDSSKPVTSSNPASKRFERDYRIPDGRKITGTPEKRFKMNTAAIRLMQDLKASGRMPTPDEQATLASWVGWGGAKQVFAGNTPEWREMQAELKGLVTDEEYEDASASTMNAHYTSDEIADAMWAAVTHMGARPGLSYLEPAIGAGVFFGRQPAELLEGARRVGIDKDRITAGISSLLYPDSGIENTRFEESNLPSNYFDIAISNVPFGNFSVYDAAYKSKPYLTDGIHNYFFAKTLEHVRPGGLIAFVTSTYTLDAYSKEAILRRKWINDKAEFLGAVRLPSGAFRANANTDVVTDVIFLRKRRDGEEPKASEPKWTETKDIQVRDKDKLYPRYFALNQYYHDNPKNILGEQLYDRGAYKKDEYTVKGSVEKDALIETLKRILPADALKTDANQVQDTRVRSRSVSGADAAKVGAFVFDEKGRLFRKSSKGELTPLDVSKSAQNRIRGMMGIRDVRAKLLDAERAGRDDQFIEGLRKQLNDVYDKFVAEQGYINSRANIKAFEGDPDHPLLLSLETKVSKDGAEKARMFSKRIFWPGSEVSRAETSKDALLVSLNETGRIDWDRMQKLTGKSAGEMQDELAGLVYQDPTSNVWMTADEYLSGSVRKKLREARKVVKIDPRFQPNVDALEKVIPPDITPGQIAVKVGATWIPDEMYTEFIRFAGGFRAESKIEIHQSPNTGWRVVAPFGNEARNTFSTKRMEFKAILQHALDGRRAQVSYKDSDGKTHVDVVETLAANAAIDSLNEEFGKWLFGMDRDRATRAAELYNETNNDLRPRAYDGSHLSLSGKAGSIELFPHQKNAIWRVISSKSSLLAHTVGAGKTFVMIAAGMELKRMGLVKRPMYVVPNATLGGWQEQFSSLYPDAKVIHFTENDLKKNKRRATIARIANEDWDAVVIPHSSFQFIRASDEMFEAQLEKLERLLDEQIDDAMAGGVPTRQISAMERAKENTLTRMKERRGEARQDQLVNWEELGIDQLFVDEAHEYKKLGFSTKMGNIAGVDQSTNQKTFDLEMKVRHVQQHGRGVVFATGTPVTNTMGELFSMMRYLVPLDMVSRRLSAFDEWAASFGRVVPALEPKPEGGGYRIKQRFAKFVNVPELSALFRSFADVITGDMLDIPRPTPRRHTIVTEMDEQQLEQMTQLQQRAEAVRRNPRDANDNMLSIYTDAQKLAIDARFSDPWAQDHPGGRLNTAANKIAEIWERTADKRSTQVVFADFGTPKDKKGKKKRASLSDGDIIVPASNDFNVYEELKRKLIERGVPANEIAFIHDAKNKTQRGELGDKVRAGEIRIIFGSSIKLGVGVNIQDKIVAMHHLDLPHLPAYVEQRDGRGWRQGNENPEVDIYTYLTKGSLDELRAANLARKAKFIATFLKGDMTMREMEDVSDMAATYEQFQMATANDPLVPRMIELSNQVQELDYEKKAWYDKRFEDQRDAAEIPARLRYLDKAKNTYEKNLATINENENKFSITGEGEFEGGKDKWEDIQAALASAMKKNWEAALKDNVDLGTVNGLPLTYRVQTLSSSDGSGYFSIFVGTKMQGGVSFSSRGGSGELVQGTEYHQNWQKGEILSVDNIKWPSEQGLSGWLHWAVDRMTKGAAEAEQRIEQETKRLASLEEDLAKPWSKEEEFTSKQNELREVQTKMGVFKADATAATATGDIKDDTVEAAESDPEEDEEGEDEEGEDGDEEAPAPPLRGPRAVSERRRADQGGMMRPDLFTAPLQALARRMRRGPAGVKPLQGDYFKLTGESEDRVQNAGKPMEEVKTTAQKLSEFAESWNGIWRVYRNLPREKYGRLIFELKKLEKSVGVASSQVLIDLTKAIGDLSPEQYELFRKAVILDDLVETVDTFQEQGEVLPDKLAFGYDEETLRSDHQRAQDAVAADPAVRDAMTNRRRMWASIKREYMGAMRAIGEEMSEKLKRQNYYRHRVLLVKRLERLAAANPQVESPNRRSFLQGRRVENVGKDYATNFVQTEMDVMTQLLVDTRTAKFIKFLDENLNIIADLKQQAKDANVRAVMPYFADLARQANADLPPSADFEYTAEDMFRQVLNTQQAIALNKLGKMAARGALPDTADGKYSRTIENLATAYIERRARREGDEGPSSNELEVDGDLFKYLSWLMRRGESDEASGRAAQFFKGVRAKQQAIKRIAGDKFVTWEDLLPEGYEKHQIDPRRAFYTVFTIPEQLAMKIMEDQAEEAGVTAADVGKAQAVGAQRDPMVLPAEVVKQFKEMEAEVNKRRETNHKLIDAARWTMAQYKRYLLLAPQRLTKYLLRNQSGDMDAMVAGLPTWATVTKGGIKELAWKHQGEIKDYFLPILKGDLKNVKMTDELRTFAEFGAFEGLLASVELDDGIMPDVLEEFTRWEQKLPPKTFRQKYGPKAMLKGYFRRAEVVNNWREAANRYSVYRVFLEDIKRNNGKPSTYSASIKAEVDALPTAEEKAYRMSNDLMGAYDEVSIAGQALRTYLIPFWSYQELNFKRYFRLISNGVREGMDDQKFLGMNIRGAARAPYFAYKMGGTATKLLGMWALWAALNALFSDDDDKDLRKEVRSRPHLTFGKVDNETIYFPRIGNISDILEWVDLEESIDNVRAAWEGRKPWHGAVFDILRGGPGEKLFLSAGHHVKYLIEGATNKTYFPNVDRPRAVESWPEKIAQDAGAGDFFRYLTGRPRRQESWGQKAADLVIYRSDPNESGYYDILELQRSWLRKQGEAENEFTSNKPTTIALRNIKKALRYRDQAAFNKYMLQYIELGGTPKGYQDSVRFMHPLNGLKNAEKRAAFVESLSEDDRRKLDMALDYYDDVFKGETAEKYMQEFDPERKP